jgi:glycosyltransferase involved in cell wall biosynthesis
MPSSTDDPAAAIRNRQNPDPPPGGDQDRARMKITIVMGFFLPVPPAAGGATEKTWHRLASEFARRGHEVTVISRRWADWPPIETRDGVRHVRLPGHDHASRLSANLLHDARWSWRVWRMLPPADVTIVNSVALPVLLGWCRRRAGRLVVMTGRIPKGQFRFYRRVDRVLAVSTAVVEGVRVENPRAARRALLTGYPIDCCRLSRPRTPQSGPLTVGYVGRVHREKGLQLLAAAVHELAATGDLPPWRILICGPTDPARGGSGPAYGRELQREFAHTGPNIECEFRPPIFNEEKLAATYREIDVFCYPSLATTGETFGVAVAEAMAAGAVPVVSALPCFADYVEPGINGRVFDHTAPDRISRLAAAIGPLLRDAVQRNRLAAAAQEAVRRFDFPPYADRLLADFSTLK